MKKIPAIMEGFSLKLDAEQNPVVTIFLNLWTTYSGCSFNLTDVAEREQFAFLMKKTDSMTAAALEKKPVIVSVSRDSHVDGILFEDKVISLMKNSEFKGVISLKEFERITSEN